MGCYTKTELQDMLDDVLKELNLSESMAAKHRPLGTPPAKLVKIVLAQKNLEIKLLKAGFIAVE